MLVPEFYRGGPVPMAVADRGAAALAALVMARWHELGFTGVKCWTETRSFRDGTSNKMIAVVRSNLINGMPPIEAEREAA